MKKVTVNKNSWVNHKKNEHEAHEPLSKIGFVLNDIIDTSNGIFDTL